MAFFASAIDTLKILVIALGAGLGAWGVINLVEGYGNDNPGAKSRGGKRRCRFQGADRPPSGSHGPDFAAAGRNPPLRGAGNDSDEGSS